MAPIAEKRSAYDSPARGLNVQALVRLPFLTPWVLAVTQSFRTVEQIISAPRWDYAILNTVESFEIESFGSTVESFEIESFGTWSFSFALFDSFEWRYGRKQWRKIEDDFFTILEVFQSVVEIFAIGH